MTSQLGNEELQYTHCSISEEVKAIKFGQLAEYSMKNIFLGKQYTKCGEETIPRFFSKKSKLSISLD